MSGGAQRPVTEHPAGGAVPLWHHPQWTESFPWLVQGITGRGDAHDPFDLGLSGEAPVGRVLERWRTLAGALGVTHLVHSRQVHGAELQLHRTAGAPGLLLMQGVDGHLTAVTGTVLTVSVADCVPVSLVSPERRAVALLHAGWRGVAAGIIERGITRLRAEFAAEAADLWLHCGPAICGRCYEVGPEVHRALRPASDPPVAPAPIDLRAVIADRAAALGVGAERISLSTHCTRCGGAGFFSHRGGSAARQMAFLGVRG